MASNSNIDTEGATQHLRDILKLDRPGNSTEEQTLHCETVKPASALVCECVAGSQLGCIYIDTSCLTWEGQPFQGKGAIMEKLTSLPFTKIAHSITAQDHQPTPDSCILSMVVGQLKADDDPIMGFHQSFILKNINDSWVCTNDMFRLAIHNFG
ncbi:nuclear transport factor 2-like protein [Lates japonicus]|uniref:Nuclear transport factor 2 n=1 Tax=Lates japonicus TaxID=270547 RepID=A0AAD3NN82_LATJO|nr:nuclear transport factor 2-like protein [Lates japonicus]